MPAEFEPCKVLFYPEKVSAYNENAECRNSALVPIFVEGQNKWGRYEQLL